jgi:hypothetical protein
MFGHCADTQPYVFEFPDFSGHKIQLFIVNALEMVEMKMTIRLL